MKDILAKIYEKILTSNFDILMYQDLYYMCVESLKDGAEASKYTMQYLRFLSQAVEEQLLNSKDSEQIFELHDFYKSILLAMAKYDFDSYLIYVEWDREPSKKFYVPRRKVLKPVVDAMQALADDNLDLLCISLPPGCGKTTLAIFFLTWIAGNKPNEPILTGSHSNSFVRGVYDEVLRIFDPNGEYLWSDVFQGIQVSGTNAKDCRIDLDKRKRFETLEFTSIGTGNAGLYRASNLLYCDDLVSGIEVALSKERLDKLWMTYTTDLRQRKIGSKCKELHIATRWSVHDIIGRLENEYGSSDRAKFIVIPALDENDESNFDYNYGVGFTTTFYHEQRAVMDDANWRALYMNLPIEREGLLYHRDELKRFFDLPNSDPDAIIAICDTKDRGTDYAFLPVVYIYGSEHYVVDCVCDNGLPNIVDARLVDILLKHKVHMCRFESNSAGGRIAEKIQKEVKERGV